MMFLTASRLQVVLLLAILIFDRGNAARINSNVFLRHQVSPTGDTEGSSIDQVQQPLQQAEFSERIFDRTRVKSSSRERYPAEQRTVIYQGGKGRGKYGKKGQQVVYYRKPSLPEVGKDGGRRIFSMGKGGKGTGGTLVQKWRFVGTAKRPPRRATNKPVAAPTQAPTAEKQKLVITSAPIPSSTNIPTRKPIQTGKPTAKPTAVPAPTIMPTKKPAKTDVPTKVPVSSKPTLAPSRLTGAPTQMDPSSAPSEKESDAPFSEMSLRTAEPSEAAETLPPTASPMTTTTEPTVSTGEPTVSPVATTDAPSPAASTSAPSSATESPTNTPQPTTSSQPSYTPLPTTTSFPTTTFSPTSSMYPTRTFGPTTTYRPSSSTGAPVKPTEAANRQKDNPTKSASVAGQPESLVHESGAGEKRSQIISIPSIPPGSASSSPVEVVQLTSRPTIDTVAELNSKETSVRVGQHLSIHYSTASTVDTLLPAQLDDVRRVTCLHLSFYFEAHFLKHPELHFLDLVCGALSASSGVGEAKMEIALEAVFGNVKEKKQLESLNIYLIAFKSLMEPAVSSFISELRKLDPSNPFSSTMIVTAKAVVNGVEVRSSGVESKPLVDPQRIASLFASPQDTDQQHSGTAVEDTTRIATFAMTVVLCLAVIGFFITHRLNQAQRSWGDSTAATVDNELDETSATAELLPRSYFLQRKSSSSRSSDISSVNVSSNGDDDDEQYSVGSSGTSLVEPMSTALSRMETESVVESVAESMVSSQGSSRWTSVYSSSTASASTMSSASSAASSGPVLDTTVLAAMRQTYKRVAAVSEAIIEEEADYNNNQQAVDSIDDNDRRTAEQILAEIMDDDSFNSNASSTRSF